MTMKKRGISPMVATMLLIIFAVAIGGVIMTWGSSYAAKQGNLEESMEEARIRCDRFVKLDPMKEDLGFCVSPIKKRLVYTVKNTGEIPINGLRLVLIGEKNLETTFFDIRDLELEMGEERSLKQDYDYTRIGHVGEVEIYPKIFMTDSEEMFRCYDKVTVEEIPQC